jgi:hypothetical protein
MGIGYNMAMCLFGGTAPLISTALTHKFHTPLAAGVFQLAMALVSLGFALHLSWMRIGQQEPYFPVPSASGNDSQVEPLDHEDAYSIHPSRCPE